MYAHKRKQKFVKKILYLVSWPLKMRWDTVLKPHHFAPLTDFLKHFLPPNQILDPPVISGMYVYLNFRFSMLLPSLKWKSEILMEDLRLDASALPTEKCIFMEDFRKVPPIRKTISHRNFSYYMAMTSLTYSGVLFRSHCWKRWYFCRNTQTRELDVFLRETR